MGKGEDESWFKAKDAAAMDHRDTMSVRVSNSAQDSMTRRPLTREESALSDGEDNAGNRWFARGRGRKGEVEGEGGAPFSRLDGNRSKGRPNLQRSQSATRGRDDGGVVLCCCGPRWGGRKASNGEHERGDVLRTKGRWEVDDDDEFYKPPVWKQIIQKVKAQTRQLNSTSIGRGEWVNYDPQSYEKNFDNGLWRDTSRQKHYDENDEDEKLGLKERARHTALLQKFASTRSQKQANGEIQLIITSPALSPLPVRTVSKSKDEFVPIWQRRASSPITLDVRQRVA
ncbi:hypothetical protein M758_9G171700 [Ceratodon purpureus]|uniref:Uncharacterized protein n=1 Tax=Ceratodon purpureus TaxID=3225 RepID=A0A8T0GT59_CERPU|nr:hypothetical protein KC19_9G118500 [Ceratodon purpureus]KAG0606833.1 hypothetical protein M758_9G171700 [Ceratodon purpureus]